MEINIFIFYITFGSILMMFLGVLIEVISPRYQKMAKIAAIGAYEFGLIVLATGVVMKIANI